MRKNKLGDNEQGFTMLEFLFTFSLFLTIIFFFPVLIKLLDMNPIRISYDIDLFFEHIGSEIVEAQSLSVSGNTLLLKMHDGRTVSYEKYNENIRRQVNGAGNEIFVQGIKNVTYLLVPNGVTVTVKVEKRTIKKRLSLAPYSAFYNLLFRGDRCVWYL